MPLTNAANNKWYNNNNNNNIPVIDFTTANTTTTTATTTTIATKQSTTYANKINNKQSTTNKGNSNTNDTTTTTITNNDNTSLRISTSTSTLTSSSSTTTTSLCSCWCWRWWRWWRWWWCLCHWRQHLLLLTIAICSMWHMLLPHLIAATAMAMPMPKPPLPPYMRLTQHNNHANISELLDNLLRGYDNSVRPDFGGPPATVEVDIMVRSMGPISEVDMTYSMDCYFRQSWVDKRLAFEGAQNTLALSVSMLARIWKPDTYFYNGKQSYLHMITTPNKFVRIHQNGRVLYSSRLTIKAGCPMNLADFPMDIQKCPLKFGSFGYTTTDVIYRWNKERPAVAIAEDMKLSQFDLVDCPAGNYTDIVYKANAPDTNYDYYDANQRTHYYNAKHGGGGAGGVGGAGVGAPGGNNKPSKALNTFAGPAAKNQHVRGTGIKLNNGIGQSSGGGGGGGVIQFETDVASEYSMLIVNFHLQRHMGNFLIQVYGPCCLLVVLSWVSFWLNREATADRVSLGITTVLTMTFLGLEARTDLPKVPYPTALDFYVFLSFAFIFATILQFAVVHYFTKYGSGECYFIIEELDSDSADSEAETHAAHVGGVGVGVSSDFNVSTESQIYEVIPLSMCAIPMPTSSGKNSANSSCLGGGGSSGISMRAMQQQRRNAAMASAAAAHTKRRRWCFNWCRQRDDWHGGGGGGVGGRGGGGADSDDDVGGSGAGGCRFSFNCFRWRRRARNRVDFDTSDEDDEERHLRAAEVATTSNAQAKPPGRRRMSFYRREELEARRKGKRTPQYNSVSKIDRASRIVFPLLFLVINVFYWYAYLSRSARILKNTSATATNT